MRRRRWRYRLAVLALMAGLTAAGPAMPARAADPAAGPGCLGVSAAACIGQLRATMVLDESLVAASMARRHPTDVNGRPLGGGLVAVYARLPGSWQTFVILLHLRPDDTVERVETNLSADLLGARTAAQYDASGLYEMVRRLLGGRCAPIDKTALYQFFENSVKPRIVRQQQDVAGGSRGLHRILSHAAAVPLCGGVRLAYTGLLEWRGGKDPAGAKQKQFSSIELQ